MSIAKGIQDLVLKTDREIRERHMQSSRGHWLDYETAKGMWLVSDAGLENLRGAYERGRRLERGFDVEHGCPRCGALVRRTALESDSPLCDNCREDHGLP